MVLKDESPEQSDHRMSAQPWEARFARIYRQVKVVRHNHRAQYPTRAYPGDAGYDLAYSGADTMRLRPDEVAHVPSDIAVQWPDGVWGFIIGRSSSFQRGLLVNPTVIDAGWRGTLFAYVRNITRGWIEIEPGDRVAQIVPLPLLADDYAIIPVLQLDESERGEQGFGSSGR